MVNQCAVRLQGVSKFYKLYGSNKDRLKEVLNPLGTKYHREFYALKNVDLEVNPGEILGILGRNGSGKSTLLKIITGILIPNKGAVEVNGRISALLELGTGFNPEFTGKENIYFHGVVNGYGKDFMASKVDEIIAFADIGEYIDQPLKSYSSGMKTRLGFAVAIHVSPDILILDEVLAVGDELFRRKCYAKMEEFLNKGTTILYVSHDLNSVVQMCTNAVFLHEGRILASDKPKSVSNLYQHVIYASPENRKKLIETLSDSDEVPSLPQYPQETKKVKEDELPSGPHKIPADYSKKYLEELRPQSVVEYRNEEIDIIDAHIKNTGGQKVNVLNFGEVYLYSVKYHSRSDKSFNDITFGFAIKDSRGNILTSIDAQKSFNRNIIAEEFNPGETLEIQVEFECRIPAGTYFTNSGLSSFGTGEQMVLNRKIDSACFKVQDSSARVFGGLFSCLKTMSIKTQSGERRFSID